MKRRSLKKTIIYLLILSTIALLISSSKTTQDKVKKATFLTCKVQYGTYVLDTHQADVKPYWVMDGDPVHYNTTFFVTDNYLVHESKNQYKILDTLFQVTNGDMEFQIIDDNKSYYNFKYVKSENIIYFYYPNGKELRLTKFYIDKVNYK
jgi:hypothetical protein